MEEISHSSTEEKHTLLSSTKKTEDLKNKSRNHNI